MRKNNIVVLDGYALNPGDLSWDGLKALGECRIFERTTADKIVERAKDAEIILTNKTVLDRNTLSSLPNLKYIGVLATGYNVVDVAAATERGIVVANIPAYGTRSVAQLTFALILELAHHAGHHSNTVHDGRWTKSKDFCYWDFPLVELEGLTIGLIGFGRIGQSTAEIAKCFGMKVIACTSNHKETSRAGVEITDMETLLRKSDIVSLHCPLTAGNKGFINKSRFEMMKRSAFLINTSRGLLIDEQSLADALSSGRIAGAGLDVLSSEPPKPDNPLLKARNCIITPHIAWATSAARERLMKIAVDNVKAFIDGKPANIVS
ncbi:MAG TPA: glycerate dehydrogenase [Lentisphaeria bacterium]|nr:MAG: glycerate dehydrogenase [Lentisphaerae bacterium GWF2_50_93]HCE45795.1 glycerate dehydrogenase [Lentisphaeria bacterium]